MSGAVQFRAKDQTEELADTILLSAVMEACREGLAIIERGLVLYANRPFARTFGYVEGPDVQGKPLAQFIPESLFLFAPDSESLTQCRASECAGVRRDGGEIRILAVFATFRTRRGEFQMINFRNLNGREPPESQRLFLQENQLQENQSQKNGLREDEASQLELRKLESQRLETLGRVVGGVAHDFNNLLTGILLYCDLLTRGLETGSPLRDYVEEIRKAGSHSAGLIQQFFAASRPHAQDTRASSWSEVISGMRDFLTRILGENIELITELDSQVVPAGLNDTAMRQVALNLLLNARDAMPEGGRITVTVRNAVASADPPSESSGPWVEFTVSDTGSGMDPATCAQVCEPFFTTKAAGLGNGLGLATVQRIVSEANGTLEVQSELTRGARVSVRLPRAQTGPELQYPEVKIRA
jgi:signal transduction histidine kinase